MKKTLLTSLFALLTIITNAQELKNGTYWVQNVSSGGFISSGANWGTRCVLSPHGIDIKVTNDNGKYTLGTQIKGNGSGMALRPSDGYMDQSGTWTIQPVGDGTYTMFNGTNYFGYSATNAHPWVPRLDFTDPSAEYTHWRFWSKEELLESMKAATKDNPVDATFLIKSPDFLFSDNRILSSKVWGSDLTDTGGNAEGDSYLRNNAVAEQFNKATFDITQKLTDMPNGVYSLSVQGFYRNGSNTVAATAHKNGSEKLIPYLYAGNSKKALPSIYKEAKTSSNGGWNYSTTAGYVPNDMAGAAACFDSGNTYITTITDIVVLDGQLTIGIAKPNTTVANDWTCFDNFTLTYYGEGDIDILKQQALSKLAEYDSKNTTDDTELSDAISTQRTAVNNAESIDEILSALDEAKKAYGFYATKPEPADKPLNVSDMIMDNPSLADGSNGWNVTLTNNEGFNQKWSTYTSGNYSLLEAYAGFSELELTEYGLTQTVSLSPGMYRLKANAFFRYGTAYNTDLSEKGMEISKAYMFAGENVKQIMRLGDIEAATYANSMAEAATAFESGEYMNSLIFTVEEPTTMDVGFSGDFDYYRSWFILGPVVLEKINDAILEAEEIANFGNVKKEYLRKWKNYTAITNQALDHSEFDAYLDDITTNSNDITDKAQLLAKDAEVRNEVMKLIKTGTTTSGQFDLTTLIDNASFTKGTESWNVKNGLGWADCGTVETFNSVSGNIHQILKGMPAGSYTLKVQAFQRPKSFIKAMNDYEAGNSEVTAKMYIGNNTQVIKNIHDEARVRPTRPESDVAGAFNRSVPNTLNGASEAFKAGLYWNILRADISEDGDIELGITYSDCYSSNWISFDNFKLYYGAKAEDITLSQTEKFTIAEDTYANVSTDIVLKAGQLNALCVPFDLDPSVFESAWTLIKVDYDAEAQTLMGTVAPTHDLKAGTPCFVRVASDMTLQANDVVVHAALPDSLPIAWEGGSMVGYYGKNTLTRAYRQEDGNEDMVYNITKLNAPGYKTMILLPSDITGKVKNMQLQEVGYENMDITVNLENEKARKFINTVRYPSALSATRIAEYNAGPPARRDEPNTAVIPVPYSDRTTTLEYSLSDDFADATTMSIPAKSDFAEIANLIPQNTYYYRMKNGGSIVGNGQIHTEGNLRMIKVPSVSNVRDLGGWLTLDGNRVNYGKVYRGGEMNAGHEITEADLKELRRLGIGAEVDLRQDVDFGGTIISTSALGSDVPYVYLNQSMFADDALQQDIDKYKTIFPFILNNLREGKSVYFHCIWGADRTGATAFLLEGLIGLTLDQMYKDYELTSFSIAGLREKTGLDSKFDYINTLPGKKLQDRFFYYWNSVVGIPAEDLCEFIQIMTNGTSSLVTEISEITTDDDNTFHAEGATYYSIDGRRLSGLQPGLNIVRTADGKVRKVYKSL